MTNHTQFHSDVQDYKPACVPSLREINQLPDDLFMRYVRRGCQPEPSDPLWLLSLIEELQARVSRLETGQL